MAGEHRHLWRIAFKNFINSFRPRQIRGNHKGTDYIGNQYYEIPATPEKGKRHPTRWYDPPKGLDFQDPLPSEWMAWLRRLRVEPPTEAEISQNLALAQMKKENADKIEMQRRADGGSLPTTPSRGAESYPSYPDLKPGDNHQSKLD